MDEYYSDESNIRKISSDEDLEKVKQLLASQNLRYDEDINYTAGVFENNRLIGTGSLAGDVLKCFAFDDKSSGQLGSLVTHLLKKHAELGGSHTFVYTKPTSAFYFENLGFCLIASVPGRVSLLEMGKPDIKSYKQDLKEGKADVKSDNIGSVIVNCNPFTLGHLYLIETAASQVDHLYIIVVSEDRSSFPKHVRLRLIKEGVSHLKNTSVLEGGTYVISNATFPTYFIKQADLVSHQASLDATIFSTHIAPILGITKRFVGTEPYCPTTSAYNDALKEVLPKFGIKLFEVKRTTLPDGEVISASTVRRLIHEKKIEQIKDLVPESTYKFLISAEAEPIIRDIQSKQTRH